MISIYDLFLSHAPSQRKQTSSGWFSFNCPCCIDQGEARPDTKKRGGLKSEADGSIVYNCFNCQFKAGWKHGDALSKKMAYLLGKIGVSEHDIEKLKMEIFKERHNGAKGNQAISTEKAVLFKESFLPEGAKPISHWASLPNPPKEFVACMEYLYSRGPNIFSWDKYYWTPKYMIGPNSNQMNKRVIIPYFDKNKIVGWSARYANEITPKGVLRYIKDVQPDYIFNNHLLNDRTRKFIIVVEGEFDAIALDCISTLGKKLTPAQANLMKRTGKTIIILGDRESAEENLAKYALDFSFSASFPTWDLHIKDAAKAVQEYGRIYTLRTVLNSTVNDRFSIMMGMKRKITVF